MIRDARKREAGIANSKLCALLLRTARKREAGIANSKLCAASLRTVHHAPSRSAGAPPRPTGAVTPVRPRRRAQPVPCARAAAFSRCDARCAARSAGAVRRTAQRSVRAARCVLGRGCAHCAPPRSARGERPAPPDWAPNQKNERGEELMSNRLLESSVKTLLKK